MRQIILFVALLFGDPSGRLHATEASATLDRMAWLAGTWQRTGLPAGQSGYEQWTREGTQGFTGVGVSKRGDKTVFEEKLRIVVKDGDVYYVADVAHNPQPVYFKLTEFSGTGFTFENAAHDFPQKIAYRRDGNRLHARVSAGDKAMDFEFERKP